MRYAHSNIIYKTSLASIALMFLLPFLAYRHSFPISSFYNEWLAAILAILSVSILIFIPAGNIFNIPRITLLPAAFCLLVIIQFSSRRITHPDQAALIFFYFAISLSLVLSSRVLKERYGIATISRIIAISLVLASIMNTMAGVIQHFDWNTFLNGYISHGNSNSIYGNLAQSNHFAALLTMGLISIGFLYSQNSFNHLVATALSAPVIFALTFSGSRSIWLYLFAYMLISYFWSHRSKNYKLFKYSIMIFGGFMLMHLLAELPLLKGAHIAENTLDRMFSSEVHGGNIRMLLLSDAFKIFSQYPLLGAGIGQFAWQQFQLDPALHQSLIGGLYNNAHNIIFQLAAETGISGVLLLIVPAIFWVRQFFKSEITISHIWGLSILCVVFIHSMLEFPLWYLYFLAPTAFLLGLFDNSTFPVNWKFSARLGMALMISLFLISAFSSLSNYEKLESALSMRKESANASQASATMLNSLRELNENFLLGSYAEVFLSGLSGIDANNLEEKIQLNQRAMQFLPLSMLVYKQAWLLSLSGDTAAAKKQIDHSIWAYPLSEKAVMKDIQTLSDNDAQHFSEILNYSREKFSSAGENARPQN